MQTFTVSKASSLTSTIRTADPNRCFEPAPGAEQGRACAVVAHVAGLQQCTEEALFADDLGPPRGHLEAAWPQPWCPPPARTQ